MGAAKIIADTDFKIGKMQFQKELAYVVPESLASLILGNRWGHTAPNDEPAYQVPDWILSPHADARPAEDGVTLEVKDVHQTLGTEVR